MVFDDMFSKNTVYTAGEELFGLPKTDEPQLQRVKKELNLLQVTILCIVKIFIKKMVLMIDFNGPKLGMFILDISEACESLISFSVRVSFS